LNGWKRALGFAALFGPAAVQAAECGVAEKAKAVRALTALYAAHPLNSDEMAMEVPSEQQKRIRALKQAWIAAADAWLACTGPVPDVPALQAALSLSEAKSGGEKGVAAVEQPAGRKDLLVVRLGFALQCGDDNVLLVYAPARDGTGWQRVLDWQSEDYSEINGAFGDFLVWTVVPAPGTSDWRLVAAHGHPWCTSWWSGFDLDVLKPVSAGGGAEKMFHLEGDYYRGDYTPRLTGRADGFDLRLQVATSEIEQITRHGIFRYRLTATGAERVQPIAMNGRDFVNAWLQLPWSDAARFSAPEQLPALKPRHDEVEQRQKSADADDFAFGPVRACSDDPHHYQVQNGRIDDGTAMYYQIRSGNNAFTMLSASTASDPRCKGPDLMAKQ
jgi:hypothetical protein